MKSARLIEYKAGKILGYFRDIKLAQKLLAAKLFSANEAWVGSGGDSTPYGWLNSPKGDAVDVNGEAFAFSFSISASCNLFSFALLFWNQIFTCKIKHHSYYLHQKRSTLLFVSPVFVHLYKRFMNLLSAPVRHLFLSLPEAFSLISFVMLKGNQVINFNPFLLIVN